MLTQQQALQTAQLVKQVVPGQVRSRLREFSEVSTPSISEFRKITVVFIRLRGLDYAAAAHTSTAASEGGGEQAGGAESPVVAQLRKVQHVVRLVQRVLYKYEGAFSRFAIDDKGAVILGAFGLPPSHEVHTDTLPPPPPRVCGFLKSSPGC